MARFTLEISDKLNEWLKTEAEKAHRSKNKHIAALLEMLMRQARARVSNLDERWESMKE